MMHVKICPVFAMFYLKFGALKFSKAGQWLELCSDLDGTVGSLRHGGHLKTVGRVCCKAGLRQVLLFADFSGHGIGIVYCISMVFPGGPMNFDEF